MVTTTAAEPRPPESMLEFLKGKSTATYKAVAVTAVIIAMTLEFWKNQGALLSAVVSLIGSALGVEQTDAVPFAAPMGDGEATAIVTALAAVVGTFNVAVAALSASNAEPSPGDAHAIGRWMKSALIIVRAAAAISCAVSLTVLVQFSGLGPALLLMSIVTLLGCDLLMGLEMRYVTARAEMEVRHHAHNRARRRLEEYKQSLPPRLRDHLSAKGIPSSVTMYRRLAVASLGLVCLIATLLTLAFGVFPATLTQTLGLLLTALIFGGPAVVIVFATASLASLAKAFDPRWVWFVRAQGMALIIPTLWLSATQGLMLFFWPILLGLIAATIVAFLAWRGIPIARDLHLLPMTHLEKMRINARLEANEGVREMAHARDRRDRARPLAASGPQPATVIRAWKGTSTARAARRGAATTQQ
jgi:hypothetical protein